MASHFIKDEIRQRDFHISPGQREPHLTLSLTHGPKAKCSLMACFQVFIRPRSFYALDTQTFSLPESLSICLTIEKIYYPSHFPPPRCSVLEERFHPSSLTVQLLKATVEQETMIREKGK